MNYHTLWFCILCLSVGVFFPAGAQQDTLLPDIVQYKKVDTASLNLHVYSAETGLAEGTARPGIIFFFGGGWKGGRIGQFEPHAQYLARRGMVVALAEYRVESRHGTTPFQSLEDAHDALCAFRSLGSRWHLDSNRVAAAGGSAGGQLAAALPLAHQHGCEAAVQALILYNPVVDNGPHGYGYERIGGEYVWFSPFHNLKKGYPPTIFFLGDQDPLIPVQTAYSWQTRVQALGSRCDLRIYPGQGHGFFNLRNEPLFRETVYETDLFLQSLGWLQGDATIKPQILETAEPLAHAHAHNDYRQQHPLWDALSSGFTSVEADLLRQGDLLFVGHDRHELDSALLTLQELYLDPLFRRFNSFQGAIYPDYDQPFYLWLDIKYDGEIVYQMLEKQLLPYREMLSYSKNDLVHQGAVTILISGDRPVSTMVSDSLRYMFLDGRPNDLDSAYMSAINLPFVSAHYRNVVELNAEETLDASQFELLRSYVDRCHRKGAKVRLWATPENETLWQQLKEAGVDLINTDHLEQLANFLRSEHEH